MVEKATEDKKTQTEGKSESAASERKKRQFVSPHPDGGWQVKIEGGKKATKRFTTKAEAEAYAKELAKNQGTTVMRQKKDGKLQKNRY
jgi:hypothetical protein